MKKWIAKKLIKLIRIEWTKTPFLGEPEIRVFLGGTQLLLLRARLNFDTNKWDFKEY